MKKFLFLPLLILFSLVAGEALAGGISSLITGGGGKLFGMILNQFGFGENGFCWFCPIFEVLFNAMNKLATNVATNLRNVFIMTLGVGLIFFIAFKVGATVVRLQEVDLMQFMSELFKHIGRAIIAVAFLAGTIQIYQLVISPFLEYSFALSIQLLEDSNNLGGKIMQTGTSVIQNFSTSSICQNINQMGDTSNGLAFSSGLLAAMKCMLGQISASLIMGMVIGGVIMLLSAVDHIFGILGNMQLFFLGLFIFGSYFMIYLAVPFKMIDALIRLAFVCALTPLWIILWVFPQTVQYTKNAWEMLLNACLTFVCLSIILVLVFQVIDKMLPNKYDILAAMIPGFDKLAAGKTSLVSSNTLLTGALGLLCWKMVGVSSTLAERIVKSYSTNVGEGLDSQMAKGMGSMGGAMGALGSLGAGAIGGGIAGGWAIAKDASAGMRKMNVWRDNNDTSTDNQKDNSQKARTPTQYQEGNNQGNTQNQNQNNNQNQDPSQKS